ncbi:hypothetical protein D6745_02185 [Candidatus Woesearchaeota archaeon]|nr:MAG: hypothetical protein D6745_02185 [Candidatus Woesearchaeota archaeon]
MEDISPEEARKYLRIIDDEKSFHLYQGPRIKNIEALAEVLDVVNDDIFKHHVTKDKNDFATWIDEVVGDKVLARRVLRAKDRSALAKVIERRVHELTHVKIHGTMPRNKFLPPLDHIEELLMYRAKEFFYGMVFGLLLGLIIERVLAVL